MEREPRGGEERRMLGRRQVANKEDVWRPRKLFGILSAADQESPLRQMSCRLDEELLQDCLPVLGISAEIGQIGAILVIGRSAPMRIRIDTAVKRSDPHRAEAPAQLVQPQAARI